MLRMAMGCKQEGVGQSCEWEEGSLIGKPGYCSEGGSIVISRAVVAAAAADWSHAIGALEQGPSAWAMELQVKMG